MDKLIVLFAAILLGTFLIVRVAAIVAVCAVTNKKI